MHDCLQENTILIITLEYLNYFPFYTKDILEL